MTMVRRPPTAGALGLALTVAAAGVMLVLNLTTGILTARLLAPHDRGSLAAVIAWITVVSGVSALGTREGFIVGAARNAQALPTSLRSAVPTTVGLGLVGCLVAEAVALIIIRPGDLHTAVSAFLPVTVLVMTTEVLIGIGAVAGRVWSVLAARVVMPLSYCAGLLLLAAVRPQPSVTDVLLVNLAATVVAMAFPALRVADLRRTGRFDRDVVRSALRFGLRAQGLTIANVLNARLDLLVLPLLVPLAQVGFYAVATSVSTVVVVLFGRLGDLLLPRLAAKAEDRRRAVAGTLAAVLLSATVLALALFLLAPVLVPRLYGAEYAAAVPYIRILLPGTVMWAMGAVAVNALQAAGRPGAASAAEICGLAITVPGLLLLVPRWGVTGACVTSVGAYAVAGLAAAALYFGTARQRSSPGENA
jgi:O-antigen/teichoic acid export membrane protein